MYKNMMQRYFKLKRVVLFVLFLFFALFLIELAIKKKDQKNVSIITNKDIYNSQQTNSVVNNKDKTLKYSSKTTVRESKENFLNINRINTREEDKDIYGQNYARSIDNDEVSGKKFKTDDHINNEKEYYEFDYSNFRNKNHSNTHSKSIYEPLKCNVNNVYQVDCIFKNERFPHNSVDDYEEEVDEEGNVIESKMAGVQNVVYVPFDFLSKYYEVHGSLEKDDDGGYEFVWKNTIVKVVSLPYDGDNNGGYRKMKSAKYLKGNTSTVESNDEGGYNYDGHFLWFHHYNVESRERVKCVSAKEGVPMSQQWGDQGYFYPTQIAQFGLSHYGKWLIDPQRLHFSMGTTQDEWQLDGVNEEDSKKALKINKFAKKNEEDGGYDEDVEGDAVNHEVHFSLAGSKAAHVSYNIPQQYSSIKTKINKQSTSLTQLSFCISSASEAVLSIVLNAADGKTYTISYSPTEQPLSADKNTIYYGYGSSETCLYRNIAIDLEKGLQYQLTHHQNGTSNHRRQRLKSKLLYPITLLRVELRGVGVVKDLQLSNQNHLKNFFMASDWFVRNQDDKGGWAIGVGRVLVKSPLVTLQKGWYSGMSQGHAMSLLVRAYAVSHHTSYLRCAFQALRPLLVDSKEGGVATKLFQQFDWFEEYPSHPPSYVLNGFMFAIFGLHDLSLAIDELVPQRERCYHNGSGVGGLKKVVLGDGLSLEDEGVWRDARKKISVNYDVTSKKDGALKRMKRSVDHSGIETENDFDVPTNDQNVKNINISKNKKSSKTTKINRSFKKQRKRRSDKKISKASSMMNIIFHNHFVDNNSNHNVVNNHYVDSTNATKPSATTACLLHKSAMKTLRVALPLYDSGSGSFYDLRHFSLPGIAPNVARWDYHSTHLSQLMQMLYVASHGATQNSYDVNLFKKYIERWTAYMKGKRAPHN